MNSYIATVHHTYDGKTLCITYPAIAANSFCMAAAFAEQFALGDSRTGEIIKIEVVKN